MTANNKKITLGLTGTIFLLSLAWYSLDHRGDRREPIITDVIATSSVAQAETIIDPNAPKSMHHITLETNKGTIVFETYDEDAPKTVQNFISLAKKGFYNGLIFHRVIEGFMIQGGDPTGTGMGGPGYKFDDELSTTSKSYKMGYQRGVVAMANSGPNTNGSQFFIMQKDLPYTQLAYDYTIFGKVISGIEVVDAIAKTKVDTNKRPLEKMIIQRVSVKEL